MYLFIFVCTNTHLLEDSLIGFDVLPAPRMSDGVGSSFEKISVEILVVTSILESSTRIFHLLFV